MSSDVTLEPALYYEVTARDNNPDCRNYNQVFDIPQFYSNDGIRYAVVCGVCGQQMEILTATLLDPQPEVS
ncbi:hypothetical protein [Streptomyces natalensis]|uniref:Uncharacterized protein n=1 Tax=Streptomyces natalensis ATCC 27448 TaxID=1240678 RepID=A0A0D7CKT6_9ACTN|nr:hypothetical protein [Streptomyces natalensis]KIZ16824.1 hypothetical protein SNA_17645 [Streptomyces natalensis ATCC 27448]